MDGMSDRSLAYKKKGDNLSERPTIVMDYGFVKPTSAANSLAIPVESVTCIAVKEDRQQNMRSSVVLKNGIEEPWARKRVARYINSSGYKEIT